MAITTHRDIYGWETGANYGIALSGVSVADAYLLDGTANTGCYYGRTRLRSAGGSTFTRVFSSLTLPSNTISSWMARTRFFLRVAVAPDGNSTVVLLLGDGAAPPGGSNVMLRLSTDLTWDLYQEMFLPTTVAGGNALTLNTWTEIVALFQWVRTETSPGVFSDTATCSCTINGQTLSNTGIFTNLISTGRVLDRIVLGTVSGFSQPGPLTAGIVHFDDLTVMMQGDNAAIGASVTLPTATRIRLIAASVQGASAAWTGPVANVQEVQLGNAAAGQTSAVAGQVTTFGHSTFAQFGFSALQVFKVYGHLRASLPGPTTQQIRLNGVDYPVSITNLYQGSGQTPIAVDWTPYTATQFNAAEFGVVNSTGASLTLGAIHGEVLYTPGATNWLQCNSAVGGGDDQAGGGSSAGGGGGIDPNYVPPCTGLRGSPRIGV